VVFDLLLLTNIHSFVTDAKYALKEEIEMVQNLTVRNIASARFLDLDTPESRSSIGNNSLINAYFRQQIHLIVSLMIKNTLNTNKQSVLMIILRLNS
jgi:hypothetical protein